MAEATAAHCEVVDLEERPSVGVRIEAKMADLDVGAMFSRYLPVISGRLEAQGLPPAGPPYGRFYEFGPDDVDMEIGIPVAMPSDLAPLQDVETGEIAASQLPSGRAAMIVHMGSYTRLRQSWEDLQQWIVDQGLEAGAGPWESYVDDPEAVDDISELRTEIYWPVS